MVNSVSSGSSSILLKSKIEPLHKKESGGAKLDINDVPKSKVRVQALHTENGKGLKIDIQA